MSEVKENKTVPLALLFPHERNTYEVACRAGLWYNKRVNIVVSGGTRHTPDRISLLRRLIMDTLPLFPDYDNLINSVSLMDYILLPRKSGIYCIRNTETCDIYVGSAVNLSKRCGRHFHALGAGSHHNAHLLRSFRNHGHLCFRFEVIEMVDDRKNLIMREQYYIDTLRPGYNMSPTAGSQLGMKHSPETVERQRAANKGKMPSPETIRRSIEVHKGEKKPPITETHRRHLSEARKGRKQSEAQLRANRESHKGLKASDETRRRMSESHKNLPFSESHRQHISETKNSPRSQAQLQQLWEAKKGKPCSEETRRRISETKRRKRAEGCYDKKS